jgi:hypothetical protein
MILDTFNFAFMNLKKSPPNIFNKSLYGVITIIALASVILARGKKEKNEFHCLAGTITAIEKSYQELPIRHQGKYRYLTLDKYQKVFEIFIGKDPGDFKPALEKIDELKIGDNILVYFDEDPSDTRINRLIQFIDKDSSPYYTRGSHDKMFGYILIATGLMIGILLLVLKDTGKIT